MKKTVLAVLTGGALTLTAGCTNAPTAAPAPATQPSNEVVAEEPPEAAAQEELLAEAAEDFGRAYDSFVIEYNEGIENGDDVLQDDPSASLDGFSQQRDALYDFDKALRDIEYPDEIVPDVNEYLEKVADLIAVLDEIGEAETVGELDTLYERELQDARDEEDAALQTLLEELEIDLEEVPAEDEAPTIGGGSKSGGNESESGDETTPITDAEVLSQELQDALTMGSAPVNIGGGMMFPEEWLIYTEAYSFVGPDTPMDGYTIQTNGMQQGTDITYAGDVQYIGAVLQDIFGQCEAIAISYGEAGDALGLISSNEVRGECSYENGMRELGYMK